MLTHSSSHLSFSRVQQFPAEKLRLLRWEYLPALAISGGLWFLIIKGVEFLISRSPFG